MRARAAVFIAEMTQRAGPACSLLVCLRLQDERFNSMATVTTADRTPVADRQFDDYLKPVDSCQLGIGCSY
jgi:hypothetical protein